MNKPVGAFMAPVRSVWLSECGWRAFSIKEMHSLATVQSFHTLGIVSSFRESRLMVWLLPQVPRGCRDLWRNEERDYSERQRWAGRRRQVMRNSETPTGKIATRLILQPSFLLCVTHDYTTASSSESVWLDERCSMNAGVEHRSSASRDEPNGTHCVMLSFIAHLHSCLCSQRSSHHHVFFLLMK